MEFIFKYFILFLLIIFLTSGLKAQNSLTSRKRIIEKGFVVGMGNGIDTFNLPEGRYIPVFLMANFGINLKLKKFLKEKNPLFSMYIEPQINPVFIRKGEKTKTNLEFGVNIGFKHMYPISNNLYTYILIGSGPQFFTTPTTRQARGFIFSDNFGMGLYLFLNKNTALNIGFRLRHMSNANTRMPNHGINTYNYLIGLTKIIR